MWYRHTYQVIGSGRFPIDMLRYDGSYPKFESQDSYGITRSLEMAERAPEVPTEIIAAFGRDYSTGLATQAGTAKTSTQRGWVITLVHTDATKNWAPTEARWRSFGWAVVPKSHHVEKR